MTYILQRNPKGRQIDVGYVKPNVLKAKAIAMIQYEDDEVNIYSTRESPRYAPVHGVYEKGADGFYRYPQGPEMIKWTTREWIGYVYKRDGKFYYQSYRNYKTTEINRSGYPVKPSKNKSPMGYVDEAFAESKRTIKL